MVLVKEVTDAIKQAERDPLAFFGSDPHKVLRQWQVTTHPDKWSGMESVAKRWFAAFSELAEQSKIRETIGDYRVVRKLPDGDLCHISICERGGEMFLAKKPMVKAVCVMKREVVNLQKVVDGCNPVAKNLFPKYINTVDGANVFRYGADLESLTSLFKRYPIGVDGRHVGWIAKRVLLALTWTHAAGIVHGAVTPDHILVCKSNHGIALCDWVFSGKRDDAIKFVPAKHTFLYPEFATKEKKLSYRMDIAMAGRCLAAIMHDGAPQRLKNFIRGMGSGIMGDDAKVIHDSLDELLRSVFGSPRWVELD